MRVLDTGPAIEDLGSSNGTFVNEQRVQGTRALAPGDAIRFGTTVWRLRDARPAPPPPPPPAARGDVPAPPEVVPSAVHRVLPPPPPGEAGSFQPMPSVRPRGSAATRIEATIVCFAIVAATAIALILYFALYEP
jgi:hypothetical protein